MGMGYKASPGSTPAPFCPPRANHLSCGLRQHWNQMRGGLSYFKRAWNRLLYSESETFVPKHWTAWTVLHLNKQEGAISWATFIAEKKKKLLTKFTFFLTYAGENRIKGLTIHNQRVENQCCRQCCSFTPTFTHCSCWCSVVSIASSPGQGNSLWVSLEKQAHSRDYHEQSAYFLILMLAWKTTLSYTSSLPGP